MRTTARMRTAAASPAGSSGSTVHPESGSLTARDYTGGAQQRSDGAVGSKSPTKRGKQLWGKAREGIKLPDVHLHRNPDANTFRPNGAETDADAYEVLIRKRDPLRGKKAKLASYCLLLAMFLATSMGARPTLDIYSQNSVLENLLMMRVDEESGMQQQALGIAWSFITTEDDFWLYMTEGIPGGVHGADLLPGRDSAAVELLTGYRIKQARVAQVPCQDSHPFQHTRALMCTPAWEMGEEDKTPYGPQDENGEAIWTHSSEEDMLGFDSAMAGYLGSYPLGGFVVHNISTSADEFREMMQWLRESKWIDTQTRQVQIDVNVWNPTLRLISAIKLQAEFSVVGKVRTMYTVRTFEYKTWIDTGRSYWWWEVTYCLMIIVYAIEEVWGFVRMHYELRKTTIALEEKQQTAAGKKDENIASMVEASLIAKREFVAVRKAIDDYVSDPWNYMDWTNYTIAAVVIVMEMWSRALLQSCTGDLNDVYPGNWTTSVSTGEDVAGDFDKAGFFAHFVCFFYAAWLSAYAYTLMGVNAVVTWLKVLKYLNLFPHLSMLSITLRNAAYPAVSFSVMFGIVFCSCGQAFLLAFGPNLRDYSTFGKSIMSLFRALLGDFDYPSIEGADPVPFPGTKHALIACPWIMCVTCVAARSR
jgi:hypothetical protein